MLYARTDLTEYSYTLTCTPVVTATSSIQMQLWRPAHALFSFLIKQMLLNSKRSISKAIIGNSLLFRTKSISGSTSVYIWPPIFGDLSAYWSFLSLLWATLRCAYVCSPLSSDPSLFGRFGVLLCFSNQILGQRQFKCAAEGHGFFAEGPRYCIENGGKKGSPSALIFIWDQVITEGHSHLTRWLDWEAFCGWSMNCNWTMQAVMIFESKLLRWYLNWYLMWSNGFWMQCHSPC